MTEVCLFFSFLRILLVELSPRALCLTEFLEDALMSLLLIEIRVLENLFIFIHEFSVNLLQALWITETSVQHFLIIPYQSHLSRKAFIPMILCARVNIILFLKACRMRLISSAIVVDLRILSKVVVECAFLICWLIDGLETSCTIRNVGVTTSAIVRIVNWL